MQITLKIPDDLAAHLIPADEEPSRAALEAPWQWKAIASAISPSRL